MALNWEKLVTSGSNAELATLATDSTFEVSGSLIILNNLPTQQPTIQGRLWKFVDANGSFLKVRE